MKHNLQLTAAPLSLEGLDALAAPDLVAFVCTDERPLRGLAGLADWRLCGDLTRVVKAKHFDGAAGEPLLTVSGGRLPAQRIFLFGVGPAAGLAAAPPGAYFGAALAVVVRAGGTRITTALPAGESHPIAILARPLVEAAHAAGLEELVLLHADARAADRALAVAAEALPGVRLGA